MALNAWMKKSLGAKEVWFYVVNLENILERLCDKQWMFKENRNFFKIVDSHQKETAEILETQNEKNKAKRI